MIRPRINQQSSSSQIVNENGTVSSLTISRAFNIGSLSKDISIEDLEPEKTCRPDSFFVIPLTEGTINVKLSGSPNGETYTITESEVLASLGYPIPYLVEKVFKEGTSSELNIGW